MKDDNTPDFDWLNDINLEETLDFIEEQGKQLVAEFMEKTKEIGYISNNR